MAKAPNAGPVARKKMGRPHGFKPTENELQALREGAGLGPEAKRAFDELKGYRKMSHVAMVMAKMRELQDDIAPLLDMDDPGRAPHYRPSFDLQVTSMCLLGLTDQEIAERLEVSVHTLNTWKRDCPSFKQALITGREAADELVVGALYASAVGYEHEEDDIRTVALGDNAGSEITITPTVKRYPPNQHAISLILANRQRKRWPHYPGSAQRPTDDRSPQEIAAEVQEAIRAALCSTSAPTPAADEESVGDSA